MLSILIPFEADCLQRFSKPRRLLVVLDSRYDGLLPPLTSVLLYWFSYIMLPTQVVRHLTLILALVEANIWVIPLIACPKLITIEGLITFCCLVSLGHRTCPNIPGDGSWKSWN